MYKQLKRAMTGHRSGRRSVHYHIAVKDSKRKHLWHYSVKFSSAPCSLPVPWLGSEHPQRSCIDTSAALWNRSAPWGLYSGSGPWPLIDASLYSFLTALKPWLSWFGGSGLRSGSPTTTSSKKITFTGTWCQRKSKTEILIWMGKTAGTIIGGRAPSWHVPPPNTGRGWGECPWWVEKTLLDPNEAPLTQVSWQSAPH